MKELPRYKCGRLKKKTVEIETLKRVSSDVIKNMIVDCNWEKKIDKDGYYYLIYKPCKHCSK